MKKPEMRFIKKETRSRKRNYMKNVFNSTRRKMSRGASNISKIITWARNENWRRKEKKK